MKEIKGFNIPEWNIEETTGYTPQTTFYQDFSIADKFGEDAIRETYARAFEEWRAYAEYLTELVLVLNWKIWEQYEAGRQEYAIVYHELWQEATLYALDNLTGAEKEYFLKTTD